VHFLERAVINIPGMMLKPRGMTRVSREFNPETELVVQPDIADGGKVAPVALRGIPEQG
jgi:hypothetical protein